MNILGRRGTQDFAAIEMYDGILYVVMNVGDGVHHIRASETVLNDGQPHSVSNLPLHGDPTAFETDWMSENMVCVDEIPWTNTHKRPLLTASSQYDGL